MTTVFLSGSRKISRLNEEVRSRLGNIVQKGLDVITGDANGADKAMQSYLAELKYPNVQIYYVGESPRNNVGNWREVWVDASPSRGRDFYAQKDKVMSKDCDYGFVLWDGKSPGSVQNMFWLAEESKRTIVYLSPERRFQKIGDFVQLVEFLRAVDDETLDDIGRKIELPPELRKQNRRQSTFVL